MKLVVLAGGVEIGESHVDVGGAVWGNGGRDLREAQDDKNKERN